MVRACAVNDCKNNLKTKALLNKRDLLFHRFPRNLQLRNKWIQFCQKGVGWVPTVSSCICSEHFKRTDYCQKWRPGRRILFKDAVPTLPSVKLTAEEMALISTKNSVKSEPFKDELDVRLERFFNGEFDDEKSSDIEREAVYIKQEVLEEEGEEEEMDNTFDEMMMHSGGVTAARICDSDKARQIASQVLSSSSDVQMLVVVTPEDLETYESSINENETPSKTRNSASNNPSKAKPSFPKKNNHNSERMVPIKTILKPKENISSADRRTKRPYDKSPFLISQESLKKNRALAVSNKSSPKFLSIRNKLNLEKEEASDNSELGSLVSTEKNGARGKNVSFVELTSTGEVLSISNNDDPSSQIPQRKVTGIDGAHILSVEGDSVQTDEALESDEEKEDKVASNAEKNSSLKRKVEAAKRNLLELSRKSFLQEADADDLEIFNQHEASLGYAMSPSSSDLRECESWDTQERLNEFSDSSHQSSNNEEGYAPSEEDPEFNPEETDLSEREHPVTSSVKKKDVRRNPPKRKSAKKINSSVDEGSEDFDSVEASDLLDGDLLSDEAYFKTVEFHKRSQQQKIEILQKRLKLQSSRVRQLTRKLNILHETINSPDHVIEILKDTFDGFMQQLALNEYESRHKLASNNGMRYREDIKTFAKTIYLQSASMYRYMRTLFKLPHPSNLRMMLKEFKNSMKTADKSELVTLLHGTDFRAEDDENEGEVVYGADEATTNCYTYEGTEKAIPIESSQLLDMIENCEVYFEPADGETETDQPEQKKMQLVEGVSHYLEEIDVNGERRLVLMQMRVDGDKNSEEQQEETEQSTSIVKIVKASSPRKRKGEPLEEPNKARKIEDERKKPTRTKPKIISRKKNSPKQVTISRSGSTEPTTQADSPDIVDAENSQISGELHLMNIIVKEEIVSSEQTS